jgi:hypothetical protein
VTKERVRRVSDLDLHQRFGTWVLDRGIQTGDRSTRSTRKPLLNFEWVDELVFWRMGGVKGGRSPAQRTLEADRAPATLA